MIEHLENALAALQRTPPDRGSALTALETVVRVAQGWPNDKLVGARVASADWARRAILRGPADLSPVIRVIEAAIARKVVVDPPKRRTIAVMP